MKKIFVLALIYSLFFCQSKAQTNKDFQECLFLTIQVPEIKKHLFSFVDPYSYDTLLAIESSDLYLNGEHFYPDRYFFEKLIQT